MKSTQEMPALLTRIDRWGRQWRLSTALRLSVWGASAGLGVGLAISAARIAGEDLLITTYLALVLGCTLGAAGLALLARSIWPVDRLALARKFDRELHLKERLSTALEIAVHPGRHRPYWRQRQLQDALDATARIDPRVVTGFRLPRRALIPFIVLLPVAVLIPEVARDAFHAAAQKRALRMSIAREAAMIEGLEETLQTQADVDPAHLEGLYLPLAQARAALAAAQTAEGAVAALDSTERALLEEASSLSEQARESVAPLLEHLREAEAPALQRAAEALENGDVQTARQALRQIDPTELTSEDRMRLAAGMEELAEHIGDSAPARAAQLRAAAESLDGEGAPASRALEASAQALAEADSEARAAELAAQLAQEMASSQLRIAGAASSLAQGAGSGGGQGSEESAEDPASGTAGGSGQGRGEGEDGAGKGTESGVQPIHPGGAAGDGGERERDLIYVPGTVLDGEGVPLRLPGTEGGEGEVVGGQGAEPGGPDGATVPYLDVLPVYTEAYRRALNRGEIPLHLRSLVRDYFTQLEP